MKSTTIGLAICGLAAAARGQALIPNGDFETVPSPLWVGADAFYYKWRPAPPAVPLNPPNQYRGFAKNKVGVRYMQSAPFNAGNAPELNCHITFDAHAYLPLATTKAWVVVRNTTAPATSVVGVIPVGAAAATATHTIAILGCDPATVVQFIIQDTGAFGKPLHIDNVKFACINAMNTNIPVVPATELPTLPASGALVEIELQDCNANGIPDLEEIANGHVVDLNGDLIPDTCQGVCYANCDGSVGVPCWNVLDFACFLNLFASGHPNANCDQSTGSPLLNVQDFSCFLNAFAGGCSSC
jgi:hypothetical protein